METDILIQGLELMLAGMGAVFVFLTVLVAATGLMSRLVMRYQPTINSPEKEEEIAAISAAIARHRGERRS